MDGQARLRVDGQAGMRACGWWLRSNRWLLGHPGPVRGPHIRADLAPRWVSAPTTGFGSGDTVTVSWHGAARPAARTVPEATRAPPGGSACPGPAGQKERSCSNGSLIPSRSSDGHVQSMPPDFTRAAFTSAGEAPGWVARYRAAPPATCGVAMEVPDRVA